MELTQDRIKTREEGASVKPEGVSPPWEKPAELLYTVTEAK